MRALSPQSTKAVLQMISVVIAEDFMGSKKAEYINFIEHLGSNVKFSENKWVCDKLRRSPAEDASVFTLYFGRIPEQHREIVKHFSAIRIIQGKTIATAKASISDLARFFDFWTAEYKTAELCACDEFAAARFCQYLRECGWAESTNGKTWGTVSTFLKTMNGWDDMLLKTPFSVSPFYKQTRFDSKYIPADVVSQLDEVFKKDVISLHLRCAYWLLRLIPSRVGEVVGMRIDCLKRYNGDYVLFIPTWKQNGGRREPIMRSIHLEETGIAGYLIALVKKQQDTARRLQEYMPDHKKGALLTYCVQSVLNGGGLLYLVSAVHHIQNRFKDICLKHSITDGSGQVYGITTHQFRHNGITDRLAAGFTAAQIAEITGHHGSAMILNAYAHLNLLPETIIEKQEYVLQEPNSRENRYVLFGGRILNMEEQLEKRLLRNLRAHKVRGGICSDITGCKSDMWNCLDCGFFVPDAEQTGYYEEQALLWREKCARFSAFPIIKGNAERNAELFEGVLKKLKEGESAL
jgi:integrase